VPPLDVHTSRLRIFLAVVDTGSFTGAAQVLHLTQQSVSGAVARLERDLGVPLLDRTPRSSVPTPAGHALAARARTVLVDWDAAVAAVDRAARTERRVLRVGAMAGAALELTDPIMAAFAAAAPDVAVELQPHMYDDPSGGLHGGTTDVAFLRPPLADADLVVAPLLREPRLVLVGASHPLAGRGEVRLDELRPFAAARPAGPDEVWNAFWSAGADPATSRPVTTLESAFELVASGQAFAIAPVGWTRYYSRTGLHALTCPDLPPSTLAVARRRDERNPLALRFFETAVDLARTAHDVVPASQAA
jgi:DNA-binding transcriptional LysR family regulator